MHWRCSCAPIWMLCSSTTRSSGRSSDELLDRPRGFGSPIVGPGAQGVPAPAARLARAARGVSAPDGRAPPGGRLHSAAGTVYLLVDLRWLTEGLFPITSAHSLSRSSS